MVKSSDQRTHPRVLVRVLVDFESANTYLYDYSNNLSEGGIFIETEKPQSIGSPLTLRFTLPNVDRVFEAKGKVAWINEKDKKSSPQMGFGMGVEFISMDETDRSLIRDYILKANKT